MRVLCFQISTSWRKPLLTPSVKRRGQLVGRLLVHALGLLDHDAPLQHERILGDGVVAVDQDRLGLEATVVVVQPVDHERGTEVRRLRVEVRLAVGRPEVVDVGPADVVQVLRRDVALEDVLEVRRQPEVDVEEVRHVGDVVDDLAAVGALDEHRVPAPLGPLVAGELGQFRDAEFGRGWVALVVVPDVQQSTAHVGGPGSGAGQPRRALGVGHQLALAVPTPAPVVERAGDLVALDGALRQVTAHVPAVAVEDVQLTLRIGEDHQLWCRRSRHRMGNAVGEVGDRSQAVPAARIAVRQRSGVDLADVCDCRYSRWASRFITL